MRSNHQFRIAIVVTTPDTLVTSDCDIPFTSYRSARDWHFDTGIMQLVAEDGSMLTLTPASDSPGNVTITVAQGSYSAIFQKPWTLWASHLLLPPVTEDAPFPTDLPATTPVVRMDNHQARITAAFDVMTGTQYWPLMESVPIRWTGDYHDVDLEDSWLYTGTGESRLLSRNACTRTISDKVPLGGEDDATISGDGNVVWYIETNGVSQINDSAPSVLKRLDLVSGQITTINVSGYKQALFSSNDGMRLLFTLDGELVVYRHDTGTLLHTSQALNFCVDVDSASGCEFESHRYVLKHPGTISGDVRSVLLQMIPQRAGVTGTQNTMELMLLDVDTGLLRRVAPDRDVLWLAISYSGDTIAYMDEQSDDGTYLAEERLMVIQR